MESGDEFLNSDLAQQGSYNSTWLPNSILNLIFADSFIQTPDISATERRQEVLSRVCKAVNELQAKILASEKEEDKLLLKFFAGFAFYRLCLLSELDRHTLRDFSDSGLDSFKNYQSRVEASLAASHRAELERMQRVLPAGCSNEFLFVYDSFAKYQRGLLGLATLLKFYSERAATASISDQILADYDNLLQLCVEFQLKD